MKIQTFEVLIKNEIKNLVQKKTLEKFKIKIFTNFYQ